MTMKERIGGGVRARLNAAAESDRKEEVVEELTENLYAKYQDLVAMGTDAEEAFEETMDSLGEVDELIELLGGRRETAEFEAAVSELGARVRDLAHEFKGPMKECARSAREVMQVAADGMKDVGRSFAEAMQGLEVDIDVEVDAHQFVYTVPAADLCGVELRLRSGDAAVTLWDEDTVQVIERAGRRLDESNHAVFTRREDGVLVVEQGKTKGGFSLFGGFDSDFEVYLPRRRWDSVSVHSVNGDVHLGDGMEVGQLRVACTNGDLDLGDGVRAEQVTVVSTNGNMDLGQGLVCGGLDVTSVSGDLEGDAVSAGRVLFRGTSGDVELRMAGSIPEAMELKTVSGDLAVELPESEGFAIRYQRVSGDLSSEFPLEIEGQQRSGVGRYKGAQTPLYQFRAVSGDMEIRRG